MNYSRFKIYSFITFLICTLLLVCISVLSIWGLLDEEIAWKSISSLVIVGFSFLFVFTIGQKLFENK